ncbi:MAG: hypothetical protein HYY17_11905 [Planctomycetes bacterium]|nr:hypothetical protein [Planctomycetota bacterium]
MGLISLTFLLGMSPDECLVAGDAVRLRWNAFAEEYEVVVRSPDGRRTVHAARRPELELPLSMDGVWEERRARLSHCAGATAMISGVGRRRRKDRGREIEEKVESDAHSTSSGPYRQDSHLLSLLSWFLFSTLCAGIYVYWRTQTNPPLRVVEIASIAVVLGVGLFSFVVYWLRSRTNWVVIDSEKGLVVSEREVISWSDLLRVERRTPVFRSSTGPLEAPAWTRPRSTDGVDVAVDAAILLLGGRNRPGRGGCTGLLYLFAFVALMPILEVWLPFGDRITIHHRNGTLVLRDLRGAGEFLDSIRRSVRSRGIQGVFPLGEDAARPS